MKFAHLHLHTEYSLLDGAIRIRDIVKTCEKFGMPAIAMTDHGNMYGAYKFNKEIIKYNEKVDKYNADPSHEQKKEHIKGIIGCEFYCCPDHTQKLGRNDTSHLILLAKNMQGYQNLCRLNSVAFIDGFYYKPRIDFKLLEQYHEGLICLSACINGDIPRLIIARQFDEAEALALKFKELFGEDFYFEVQNHGIPEELFVRNKLREMGEKLGIKLVGTNDCHYLLKEDAEMQDVLMCIATKKDLSDPNRMKFNAPEYYVKTRDEMAEALPGFEDALDNTLEVADKCEQIVLKKGDLIPGYKPDDGSTPEEFLRKITEEGLKEKYGEVTPEIRERVEYEMGIINRMKFTEYYLIVWDFINWAERHGVEVGPGRGSGAGSIIAYAIGITKVEPLKYALLFERFINPERVSMPDFDIDFPSDTWIEVRNYCRQKYGEDKFCGIVTFGTLAAKAVLKDVIRVMRTLPFAEANKLTKNIDGKSIFNEDKLKFIFGVADKNLKLDDKHFQEKYDNDLKQINPELRQMYLDDPNIKRIVDICIKLENMPRQCGQHAAGHIICKKTLMDNIPLTVNNGSDIALTQYDKEEVEKLGFLKMDYLRINTLNDLREARKFIKQTHGIDIDLYKIDMDDPKVYELIASGDTDAVFQIESEGLKKFMRDLKPDCLEDVIAGISLYRPGPMDFCPVYVKNKHNPDQITYELPCLEKILKPTYGVIVYQEQVMQIVQEMGGYSLGRADLVRRAMGHKEAEVMMKERQVFLHGLDDPEHNIHIDGAIKRGASEELANKIFDRLVKFASYAFNKSHAAAYSFLTYQTAYLKCYYKVEFLTAVLNNRLSKPDDLKKYIMYAKNVGIDVLPPDINKSQTYFSIENGAIRHGLAALKNFGYALSDQIIKEREENGEFKDLVDLIVRTNKYGLNKRGLESLILSGALDTFGKTRTQLMAVYELVLERTAKDRKLGAFGQISMFDTLFMNEQSLTNVDYPDIPEFTEYEKLKKEKEIVGVYVSGHPLDKYIKEFSQYNFNTSMIKKKSEDEDDISYEEDEEENQLQEGMPVQFGGIITDIKKLYTKKDNREMGIIKVEDMYGDVDCFIFPNLYASLKSQIELDKIAIFKGKISYKDDESVSVILEGLYDANQENQTPKEENNTPIKKEKVLWLKFDNTDDKLKQKIVQILGHYKGETVCKILCSKQNKAFMFSEKVDANNLLLYELQTVLPEKNIKLVE